MMNTKKLRSQSLQVLITNINQRKKKGGEREDAVEIAQDYQCDYTDVPSDLAWIQKFCLLLLYA